MNAPGCILPDTCLLVVIQRKRAVTLRVYTLHNVFHILTGITYTGDACSWSLPTRLNDTISA